MILQLALLVSACVAADAAADALLSGPTVAYAAIVLDTVMHGVIAAAAMNVIDWNAYWIALCFVLGVAVDGDHFAAAGELSMSGALHLQSRPPLHSLPIATMIAAPMFAIVVWSLMCGFGGAATLAQLSMAAQLSFVTHLLRDSSKRGTYWWPFEPPREWGLTQPLGRMQYIALTVMMAGLYRCYWFALAPSAAAGRALWRARVRRVTGASISE
jgi:hypothetical protein